MKEKRILVKKKTLHDIIWGGDGSGYGVKLNDKQTLYFEGTDKTKHFIHVSLVTYDKQS